MGIKICQYSVTLLMDQRVKKGKKVTVSNFFEEPNPPTNAVKRNRVDGRSLAIRWTPPAAGQATGYFVTDNFLNGHTNMRTDIDSITLV